MATTTNLAIEIPDVGADNNTWGTILNAALQDFDDIFKTDGTGTSVSTNHTSGVLILPQSANPTQTAEGSIAWDTDEDLLTVGTGSGRRTMLDTASDQSITGTKTFTALELIQGAIVDGTYSPTVTNVTNIASSSTQTCQYLRIGLSVTVSGIITVDPTSATTLTRVRLSLPIASNFTAARQCAGAGTEDLNNDPVRIEADATNNEALLTWYPSNSSSQQVAFTFTYRIV